MTKYIHQTRTPYTANAKISNSPHELGYTLYAEIDCLAFDDILNTDSDIKVAVDGVTNSSSSVIVGWIFSMCQKRMQYSSCPYTIKIHRNNSVEVYSKVIESQLK